MKIELEFGCEQPIFDTIIQMSDKILLIPKDLYEKFYNFLIQEERYEDIKKLEAVKHKITNKTLDELFDESDKIEI